MHSTLLDFKCFNGTNIYFELCTSILLALRRQDAPYLGAKELSPEINE